MITLKLYKKMRRIAESHMINYLESFTEKEIETLFCQSCGNEIQITATGSIETGWYHSTRDPMLKKKP